MLLILNELVQIQCLEQGLAKVRATLMLPPSFTYCVVIVFKSHPCSPPSLPFSCTFQPHSRRSALLRKLPEHSEGSQNPDRCRVEWAPLAAEAGWAPGSGPGRLGPRGVCQQPRRFLTQNGKGLGSRGLFVPLWQMVDVGSRRNRPKIVPATQTFRRHQCTPLCNNTNFVAAEKSIFPP